MFNGLLRPREAKKLYTDTWETEHRNALRVCSCYCLFLSGTTLSLLADARQMIHGCKVNKIAVTMKKWRHVRVRRSRTLLCTSFTIFPNSPMWSPPQWPPLASCCGLHPIQDDGAGLRGQQRNCTRLPPNTGQTTCPSKSTLLIYVSWPTGSPIAESK